MERRVHEAWRIYAIFLGIIVPLAAKSAEFGPSLGEQYRVVHFTAAQGLPENSVKALAQTKDGYLWIGTLGGLVRFDGVTFKVFDHSNTPELSRDAIDDLAADQQDDSLWIAAEDGLVRYEDQHFHRYRDQKLGPEKGGWLRPAQAGGVWFSPHVGVVALARRGGVKEWNVGGDFADQAIWDLAENGPGTLALVVPWTVRQFDLKTRALNAFDLPPGARNCYSLLEDSEGSLRVCTDAGLWHRRRRKWDPVCINASVPAGHLSRIFPTSDGRIWGLRDHQGRSSLLCMVGDRFEPFSAPGYPPNANVTRILEDFEGSLWVGSTSGLIQLQRKAVRVYSRPDGLTSDDTLAVACGADDTVWVATAGGIDAIRADRITRISPPEPRQDWSRVGVLALARQGGLWVGWKGHSVAKLQGADWQIQTLPPEVGDSEYLKALYEDRQGRLWVGTGQGVSYREGDRWAHYSMADGLSCNDVRVIFQDRRGDMWFGTFGGGLNRLHHDKITTFKPSKGEYNNHTWWIHEDADGVFWVGSEEGLSRFIPPDPDGRSTPVPGQTDGGWFTFTTRQGLPENVVNNVQEDDFGFLWLSGLRGIYRVEKRELEAVAARREKQVRCTSYGEADGMLSSECNGGDNQPAGCKDHRGRIYFPTAQGVAVIDPAEIRKSERPPPAVIEEVKADGETVFPGLAIDSIPGSLLSLTSQAAASKPIGLVSRAQKPAPGESEVRIKPGKAHMLEVSFTANTFIAAERARFRYRLVGTDSHWREAVGQRTVPYAHLRPGRYRFEVLGANHHGVWSSHPATFAFVLEPYLWQTWSFYTMCFIAAVGLAATLQAYRLKWQRRLLKLEEQEAVANERARIARDLHDDLGTALTGLALQLDVARREAKENAQAAQRFSQTAESARELADRMREVVWTINPHCDTVSGLANFLEQQVGQFLEADAFKVTLDFPDEIPATPLTAQTRHQLALSVREALTNIVRHAGATEVVVSLRLKAQALVLEVKDNGRGFEFVERPGHGLSNMRTRMELVGGQFACTSKVGAGTVLRFQVPTETRTRRNQVKT